MSATSIIPDEDLLRRAIPLPDMLPNYAPMAPAIAIPSQNAMPALPFGSPEAPKAVSSSGIPVTPKTPNKAIPIDPGSGQPEPLNDKGIPIKAGIAGLFTREDNIHNPVLRTAAKVGTGILRGLDTAAAIAVPGAEAKIPGSLGNEAIQTQRARNEEDRQAKLAQEKAVTEHEAAETGADVELKHAEAGKAEREPEGRTPQKTPEEQSFEGYLGQVNPETGKTFTPQEAFRKVKEDGQKQAAVNDFDAYYKDYLSAHGFQDSAAHRLAARTEWAKAGQPFGQQHLDIALKSEQDREKQADRRTIAEHDKAYVQPAEAVEKSYQMADKAYREYQAARKAGKELPSGAQSMVELSTHLSTTFGNVKGARITKDMIQHHLGARSISDDALVAVQKLTNGDPLSPAQWNAFHELIGESRKISWQIAAKEADRKKIPVDFLPQDLAAASHEPGKDENTPNDKDPAGILK